MDRRTALKGMAVAGAGLVGVPAPGRASSEEPAVPPPDATGMLYDATRCIGCQACVVACRDVNRLEPELPDGIHAYSKDLDGNTANIIKLRRSGEEHSFMKRQCMHCVDPACTAACMIGALQKREHGAVTWDGDKCIGCRYCQIACPFNVPKFEWDETFPRIIKCQLCVTRSGTDEPGPVAEGGIPACCDVCPVEAVIYGSYDDLLADAHQRLEDHPERYEPHVYGEHEAGGTQVLYLAPAGFDFQSLGLPDLGDEPVPEKVRNVQHTVYKGFAAPVLLYGLLAAAAWRTQRTEEAGATEEGSR